MRSVVAGVLTLFLAQAAGAQKLERGLSLNRDGAVRIYNTNGSVRVVGWKRDSIAVRGSLGEGNSFHFGGGRTGVKMFVEGRDERNPAPAALEVMVPLDAKVWIKTANASIDVSGVNGSLDLYVVGGRIQVTGNPADVNAEAIDGSITINGSPGWVRGKSASGNVTMKGSSGDVSLTTVSGDIDVSGGQYEKARFETVTGPIRFAGGIRRGGSATFETHGGAIDLRLSPSSPADFEVVSIAGTIDNGLTKTKPVKGRYGRGSELNTEFAGGGARVSIRSFKGPINLRRMD